MSSNVPGFFDETIKVRMGELSLLAFWPASERIALFGRAGAYYATVADDFTLSGAASHLSHSNSGFTYGLGLQYFVVGGLGLRGEYNKYLKVGGGNIGTFDYQSFTAGVLWKFQ